MDKKFFNEKHETILNARIVHVGSDDTTKDGDLVSSKYVVDGAIFHQQKFDQFGNHTGYERVYLTKEMISDLYNQIAKIESETFAAKYDSLPF